MDAAFPTYLGSRRAPASVVHQNRDVLVYGWCSTTAHHFSDVIPSLGTLWRVSGAFSTKTDLKSCLETKLDADSRLYGSCSVQMFNVSVM